MRQRLSKLWQDSQVTAWGSAKVGAGSLLFAIHFIAETLHDSDVKAALAAMNFPAYVGLGLAILGIITLAAEPHDVADDSRTH